MNFLGYRSNVTATFSYLISDDKWHNYALFRFDQTFSSVPSHSLPLSFSNMIGLVKSEETCSIELNMSKHPHHPDTGFIGTTPLQDQ